MERSSSVKSKGSVPSSPRDAPTGAAAQALPVVDSVLAYEKIHRIGEGTYGVVYKARHIQTGEIVALKKVRFDRSKEGVPVTSVRELAILQKAQHPNIVKLQKVVTGTRADSVFLVFEYCEHDLGRVLDTHPNAFSEGEAKGLFKQLLSAVAYLHKHWVLHRDLKLSNLLYNDFGELKLCDFGLARHFHPQQGALTPHVVTLWYRAPELLLGDTHYTAAVDCWALGCILGELLRGEPLFPASTEVELLQMHCQLLGAPNARIWPAMRTLPNAANVRWPDQPYNYLRRTFPEHSDAGLSLLNGLLTYDASQRLTAHQALAHEYFRERPYARRPEDMPKFPSAHSSNSNTARPSATAANITAAAAGGHAKASLGQGLGLSGFKRGLRNRFADARHPSAKFGDGFRGSTAGTAEGRATGLSLVSRESEDGYGVVLFQRYQMPDEPDWGQIDPAGVAAAKRGRFSYG